MNELSEIFKAAHDGDCITLENKIYEAAPEDSFLLEGFFFSNTAKYEENPNGERYCAMYLNEKSNITIDGNGAVVMLHGKMTPFIFCKCHNIVMKNICFDHYRPTMSEFTVTDSAPGYAEIHINDEFKYRIDGNMLYWCGDNNKSNEPYWEIPYKGRGVLTNAFNPSTQVIGDMICGEGDSWGGFPDIAELTERSKGVLQLRFRDKNRHIPVGTVAQTRSIKRVQTGGAIDRCTDITLEKLRIMSMNCFGILAQNSCNILYSGLDCTPKEGRTIVSDADFFHFSGCSGEVKVLNCKAKGAHDDIINIHGTHLKIIKTDREDNTILVRYSHPESWGFEAYEAGDRIEYVCGNTLLPYGEATVASAKKINPTDVLIKVDTLPDREPAQNDVIENVTRTASLTVENNVFECIPSRAILCTTRKDVVIRNNTFRNMGAAALCVADDANFWFESGRSRTITFENNTVINCAARYSVCGDDVIRYEPVVMDKSSLTPVHKKLILRNNRFISGTGRNYNVNLSYLEESVIEGNTSNVELEVLPFSGSMSI
ncbi:MAG: hypothetical protein MJ168_07650 [Clostridia bacterium]|nr:hypothetical protein [Clostridia bacterium]